MVISEGVRTGIRSRDVVERKGPWRKYVCVWGGEVKYKLALHFVNLEMTLGKEEKFRILSLLTQVL